MGYLVCDTCENYYELRPGEYPDDFLDRCDCNGRFIYVENLEDTIEEEISDIPIISCPSCGSINYQDAETCRSCNTYLKPIIMEANNNPPTFFKNIIRKLKK
jgi:ribosomal protein L40E